MSTAGSLYSKLELASGMNLEDVMHEYELTAEQIQAALAYAAL